MNNRSSTRWAILWLLFGGFAFGVGWLVGVALLWDSHAWNVRQKLLGTLVVPGGLAGSIFFAEMLVGSASQRTCALPHGSRCVPVTTMATGTGILDLVAAALILAAPIVVAYYLSRHRGGRIIAGPVLA